MERRKIDLRFGEEDLPQSRSGRFVDSKSYGVATLPQSRRRLAKGSGRPGNFLVDETHN